MTYALSKICTVAIVVICCGSARSQDTIQMNIDQARNLLLSQNLTLLASHLDLDIAEAQVIQAQAWYNPYFNWNQDMYSVERNEYFNHTNQFLVQVDQVFSIAGKHTNTVKLARVNAEMNKLILKDVLRSLMMELGEEFHYLNSLQRKHLLYGEVLQRYVRVIQASEKQLEVGAIASNEVVRLKSEQLALQTEALGNENVIISIMSDLKILLNLKPSVYIMTTDYQPLVPIIEVENLYSLSLEHRADYQLARQKIQYHETNLKLQKSNAYPDVTFGYQPKDKGSNYVRPYSGLELGFELPLFNRNSGNIRAAEFQYKKATLEKDLQENKLMNEVLKSYQKQQKTMLCLENYTPEFLDEVEMMNQNANENYGKHNISLLEYIDLQRIYMQNKMQYLDLNFQHLLSINQLNFSVGTDVIK